MVKASGIKVQKPEKSMFRTNAICVLRQSEPWNFKYSKAFLLRKTVTKQCFSVTF